MTFLQRIFQSLELTRKQHALQVLMMVLKTCLQRLRSKCPRNWLAEGEPGHEKSWHTLMYNLHQMILCIAIYLRPISFIADPRGVPPISRGMYNVSDKR